MIFYKGDPSTSMDWIFVNTDGGYYEVGRKYAVWATRSHNRTGELYLGCERGPIANLSDELDRYYFY